MPEGRLPLRRIVGQPHNFMYPQKLDDATRLASPNLIG